MSPLDLLMFLVMLFFTIIGLYRGFFREILSLIGFLFGLFFASRNYGHLASYLTHWFPKFSPLVNIFSFGVIFFSIVLLVALVGTVIRRLLIVGDLKFTDRFFGGVFGLLKAFLINAFIVILVVTFAPGGGKLVRRSPIALSTYQVTLMAVKFAPQEFRDKYFNRWKSMQKEEA